MASLDIRRLGLGAMALIGASLVFKGVKGKEISKKEEDNLALEIGIDSVMGAETFEEKIDIDDFNKVADAIQAVGQPATVLFETKFGTPKIVVVLGDDIYDDENVEIVLDILDDLKIPFNSSSVVGDTTTLERKEYDKLRKINGGHKDFLAESFEVETSSKGFLKENLPDSKEERLKDLKEDLEYRKRVLSQFKKLEASLMPFTTGMVGHLYEMEDKMLNFLYYAKQNIKHYTQLVAETQEQMQQIKGAEGVRESRYGSYILNFEFDEGNISWKYDVLPLIEKYTNDWNAQGIGLRNNPRWGEDIRVQVGSPKKVVLEKLKADLDALGGYIYYNAESFEAEAEWMKDCSNFVESMDYHDWNVIDVRIRPNGEHDFEMVCKKCGERAILRPQAGEIAFNQQQSLNKYPRFPYFIKLNRAKSFEAEA